jgi:hypothetical protein
MNTRRRWVQASLIGVGILTCVTAAVYAFLVRPVTFRDTRIQNLIIMRTYKWAVERFRQVHGFYPPSLQVAIQQADGLPDRQLYLSAPDRLDRTNYRSRFSYPDRQLYRSGLDRWGHPVFYRSDGTQYLLVSFGRNGHPDGSDYLVMRAAGKLDNGSCSDLNADIVFSDRGELRNCEK